jgi:K+-transporting ATPase A subunit
MYEGVVAVVKHVNYLTGTTCVMPLIRGFMEDVYCGHYMMDIVSSTIYVLVSLKS